MPEQKPLTILVVDDDPSLNRLVTKFLTQNGMQVTSVYDGVSAITTVNNEAIDLIVLDVMLPGIDGLGVCRTIRSDFKGPILMLTALDEDIDEVAGLETGADDYLAKPVRPRVLLARIRALLRRYQGNGDKNEAIDKEEIRFADVRIRPTARMVERSDKIIHLTDAEFELLLLLARNAGTPLNRDQITERLRGFEYDGLDRSIDLRISRLRKKLGDDSRQPNLIKSIRGIGYQVVI